jgi:predicted O-linked N-acetylglucosamine transferase (SPINDLY family)
MHQQFAASGVTAERLSLRGRDANCEQHLAHYHELDIALDTFPYNGTTTTCEALWMGVPVVSLAGELHQGRVGASLLSSAGLADWVAADEESYVSNAVDAAGDLPRLRELRHSLRQRLSCSALRDEAGYTRELESALHAMWCAWCANAD